MTKTEERIARLERIKSDIPMYQGSAPKAQHYQGIHDALDAAISALRTQPTGDVVEALADSNAVHVNLLGGRIARPSIEQVIHIYGRDALLAALTKAEDTTP